MVAGPSLVLALRSGTPSQTISAAGSEHFRFKQGPVLLVLILQ